MGKTVDKRNHLGNYRWNTQQAIYMGASLKEVLDKLIEEQYKKSSSFSIVNIKKSYSEDDHMY